MARRNNKTPKQTLGGFLDELTNREDNIQLRDRLAMELEARAASGEERKPQGFLSAPIQENPTPAATADEEQGWLSEVVNDAALSLRTGARGLTSGVLGAPVNIANLVTDPLPMRMTREAGRKISSALGVENKGIEALTKWADAARISQPEAVRGIQEMIDYENIADAAEYSSTTLAEAKQKFSEAEGFLDSAKSLLSSPRLMTNMALEVVPQLLVRVPGSTTGTILAQGATAGSAVEAEVASNLAKKVAAGEMTREQAESAASNAFAFSAGMNSIAPALHGGARLTERVLAGQSVRQSAGQLARDTVIEGAVGGATEGADTIIQNLASGDRWDKDLAQSVVAGTILETGMAGTMGAAGQWDARRQAESLERSRFNNAIDAALIDQGNAQLAARQAEEDARIQAEMDRANQQALVDAQNRRLEEGANWVQNAEQADMFGEDPDIVGTFEEQEALRRYEAEQRALSLQERRRAFEAAEQARAADEAAYEDVVQASRDAQFDARDEERARVAATQQSIDPAFNPPVESQMAEQLRLALSKRDVEPAVAEEVVEEVKAPARGPVDVATSTYGTDNRWTVATDGNVYPRGDDGNIMQGRKVWNPKSQEALGAASAATSVMLSLANTDVDGRAAYAAAIKEIVAADMEGRPPKFSMVMREGRGRFEGQQFPSMVVAPAVGVDGTQRVYEYVLSPDKHLRRTYRDGEGVPADVEYLVTNKTTGSREWSADPPGMLAPDVEWGPGVDITTAGEEITAQANLGKNETPSTITIEQARSLYPSRQLEWMAEDGATSVSRDRAIAMATLDAHEKLRSLLGNTDGAPVEALDRLLSSAYARASEAHPGNDEASDISRRETYLQSVHDLIAEASNKDTPLGRTVAKHKAEADAGIASRFEEGMVKETIEQSKQLADDLDSQDVTDMERRRSIKEVQATDNLFTHAAALLNIKRRRETNSLTNQEASATWDSLPKTEKFMVLENFNASPELMDKVANDVPFNSMTKHERRSVISAMVEAPVGENIRQESSSPVGEAKVVGNGFIGPVRRRRTEPNVGENRTTRIDESDPPPFPAMQRSAGTVREDAPVAEDVVQEQLELPGMDVEQPAQAAKQTLEAARKKREEKAKKELDEALKKARAAHSRKREKFLDELLARGLSPEREEAEYMKWVESNPAPTVDSVKAEMGEQKPRQVKVEKADPEARAAKAVEDQKKKDVAAWKRGETSAANRAAAEARARNLSDEATRALISNRVRQYHNQNPHPLEDTQAEGEVLADEGARIEEAMEALRAFYPDASEQELRSMAEEDVRNSTELDQLSDSNPIPEDKRASLEDIRKLLGLKKGDAVRRAIGNGLVFLVTDDNAHHHRADGKLSSAIAWYNGDRLYVNVNRLNKDNLTGELLGAVAHEGKHAADASGKGRKGIGNLIGAEANRRLRRRIEEAANNGDRKAQAAVRRARAAADKRPHLPGLYEVELPAYYITETYNQPTTLFRGLVSAVRVGAKEVLGIKDVNLNDIRYMADKMMDNLSYESSVAGDVQRLVDQQGNVDGQAEDLDQTAYHGTPHNVDRFSTLKIGTGEGNQSYGWGLYFASEKAVAEHYQKTLGGEDGNLYEVEVPDATDLIDYDRSLRDSDPSVIEKLQPAIEMLAKEKQRTTTRRMNSLEAQQSVLRGTGKEFYRQLTKMMRTPKAASEYLNSLGVPGLFYTDGESRGRVDAGTKNIVIWDDSTIGQPIQLDQDVDGTTFNPQPSPELAQSSIAKVKEDVYNLAKSMLSSTGGLGRDVNAKLQDSVGESAYYAGMAQKYQWELDRGIGQVAKATGKTVDQVNSEVAEMMSKLEKIPSVNRREAALSNYVSANPELRPMLDMYRAISGFSNEIANNILKRRPLTEADRQFAKKLKESGFAYTTRLYTSRQGEAGKNISRKMMRTVKKANKKLEKGKTLTKQEAEAKKIYDDAAMYIADRLTIPEMAEMVGMRQSRINELFDTWVSMDAKKFFEATYDEALKSGADERTAKEAAKLAMIQELDSVREVSQDHAMLNDKVNAVIYSLLGLKGTTPTASMIGGLREDRGILQKRQDLDPSIRRLMGEVTANPSVMLSVTMAKQGEIIARERFLNSLVDSGLVVPQNIAGTGPFRRYTIKLRGDTAGPLADMMTTPEVARIVNAQLEMYSGLVDAAAISFLQGDAVPVALARGAIKGATLVASGAKIASVVTSPFAMAMNLGGSFMMLMPNGVYNPKHIFSAMDAAKDSVMNTLREGSNFNEVLADAVRWNVIDSARLQELRRSVHRTLQDKVVNPSVGSKAKHLAKQGFGAGTEVFAMTDAWAKIAAFIKQKEYLADFYKAEGIKKSADDIASEAAQIVRDTNFTYSKVPPIIRNVFERLGLTMFATYFYSVPQTIAGNFHQAFRDLKRGKNATTSEGRMMAYTAAVSRAGGIFAATVGAVVLTKMLAEMVNGMGGEDEEKVKAMADMLRDEQPSGDPIYLGKDEDGNPLFFLLNRLDPYGPVNDMIRILMNDRIPDDQKADEIGKAIMGMMFTNTAIAEAIKVFTDKDRGMGDTRLERLPYVGKLVREMEGMAGYADWARSLASLVDKAAVPGVANVLDPEQPKVEGNYNSDVAKALGLMTQWTGGRAVVANPSTHLRSLGFELKQKKDDARTRLAHMINNGERPEDIAEFIADESASMFHDFERIQRVYNGMVEGLDMSPREAAAILKSRDGAGLNEVQIGLIRRGLLRGDREMAIELAGLVSKKSVTQKAERSARRQSAKEQAVDNSKEVLRILRQDYGIKVGE